MLAPLVTEFFELPSAMSDSVGDLIAAHHSPSHPLAGKGLDIPGSITDSSQSLNSGKTIPP